MKPRILRFLAIATILASVSVPASQAAILTETDEGDFLAALAPGAYTEDFDAGLPGPFTSGAFSYSITTSGAQIFIGSGLIGAYDEPDVLTITFLSGNVTAFGGNFYTVNVANEFQSGATVVITLNDGTTVNWTPPSFESSYIGFQSDDGTFITSLTLGGNLAGSDRYATVDNFTVGEFSAIPEPSASAVLLGLGGFALTLAGRRPRRSARLEN